jgi:hypothetical protein
VAGNIICKATGKSWNVSNATFDFLVGFAYEKHMDKEGAPKLSKALEDDLGYFLRTGWPEE